MRYGTVIKYFPDKRFGFIRPDVGPDVFFHITAIGACNPQTEITPGQAVKFELEPETKPPARGLSRHSTSVAPQAQRAAAPRAKLVELIDRIPGGSLATEENQKPAAHHPRARQKKPTWRK